MSIRSIAVAACALLAALLVVGQVARAELVSQPLRELKARFNRLKLKLNTVFQPYSLGPSAQGDEVLIARWSTEYLYPDDEIRKGNIREAVQSYRKAERLLGQETGSNRFLVLPHTGRNIKAAFAAVERAEECFRAALQLGSAEIPRTETRVDGLGILLAAVLRGLPGRMLLSSGQNNPDRLSAIDANAAPADNEVG